MLRAEVTEAQTSSRFAVSPGNQGSEEMTDKGDDFIQKKMKFFSSFAGFTY